MDETFNTVYGNPDAPFYYGTKPTEELKAFLEENEQYIGEALDIGCGEGRNSLFLAQYGFHVCAVDQARQGIEKLEKYAHAHGLQNISCSVADARDFQFGTDVYDLVVAVTLLDHLEKEEGKKVASALISAMKPGGCAYIEVFTIHDPGATTAKQDGQIQTVSETAYFIKHYFEERELATWFAELDTIFYEEIMKYDDSHGTPHYHGIARLIAKKPPV